jgi:hypothetical protein
MPQLIKKIVIVTYGLVIVLGVSAEAFARMSH